jgi:hypothetical protein
VAQLGAQNSGGTAGNLRPLEAAQTLGSNTNVAWEERPEGRGPYYTRSRRVDGRVVREYVGAGLAGLLAAEEDAGERASREAERARLEALRAEWGERERLLDRLDARANALLRGSLLVAGYRQHDRGEWRKQRDGDEDA